MPEKLIKWEKNESFYREKAVAQKNEGEKGNKCLFKEMIKSLFFFKVC